MSNVGAPTEIDRHKTAIPRSSVSAPIFLLQSGAVITQNTSVLDYGCGQGGDVAALKKAQFNVRGWDPHFLPEPINLEICDVVNLGFVLNVIEDREERTEALKKAFGYARQCLAVSVMLIGKGDLSNSRPYKDGVRTSRNTFQKYYSQAEIREYITVTLNQAPIAAGPGVFFIFKDEVAEQRFLFRRQIGYRATASRTANSISSKRTSANGKVPEAEKTTVNSLRELIIKLGRYPDESELPSNLQKRVSKSKHSAAYLSNLAIQEIDPEELEQVGQLKMDELSLFFALNAFEQRRQYGELPPELQRDVRAFFSSHKRAIDEGRALLFSIGNSEKILADAEAAEENGIGRLEQLKFQFHARDLHRLPITLRGYIALGERLAGDLSNATLFKVHVSSKKLTALYFSDFDTSPLPKLEKRVKIEFQDFNVQEIDHPFQGGVKLLYGRSDFLSEDDSHYESQKNFDDKLRAIDELDFSDEGPRIKEFSIAFAKSGLTLPKLD